MRSYHTKFYSDCEFRFGARQTERQCAAPEVGATAMRLPSVSKPGKPGAAGRIREPGRIAAWLRVPDGAGQPGGRE